MSPALIIVCPRSILTDMAKKGQRTGKTAGYSEDLEAMEAELSSRAAPPARPAENLLYYGDNLDILRRYIEDESIDLIYLDPPFNSNADYNVLFAEKDGTKAHAQIQAFEDTWQWDLEAAQDTPRSCAASTTASPRPSKACTVSSAAATCLSIIPWSKCWICLSRFSARS
jgi:hypothetical protein